MGVVVMSVGVGRKCEVLSVCAVQISVLVGAEALAAVRVSVEVMTVIFGVWYVVSVRCELFLFLSRILSIFLFIDSANLWFPSADKWRKSA